MPTARAFAGATVAGEKIYILGGINNEGALVVNEAYSPSNDSAGIDPWTQAAPLPDSRYAMGVSTTADIIYVGGGKGGGETVFSLLQFLPSENSWEEFESPQQQALSNYGMVSLEAFLYMLGGDIDGVPTANNHAFKAMFTVAIPLVR